MDVSSMSGRSSVDSSMKSIHSCQDFVPQSVSMRNCLPSPRSNPGRRVYRLGFRFLLSSCRPLRLQMANSLSTLCRYSSSPEASMRTMAWMLFPPEWTMAAQGRRSSRMRANCLSHGMVSHSTSAFLNDCTSLLELPVQGLMRTHAPA